MTTRGIVDVAEDYGLISPEAITAFFQKASAREIGKVDREPQAVQKALRIA